MCIDRAYLDFNRTLHGLTAVRRRLNLRKLAWQTLLRELEAVRRNAALTDSQAAFDRWHKAVCADLVGSFKQDGYSKFTGGQAQKWVNMSLKYAFALGDTRLPGLRRARAVSHAPVDKVVLHELYKHDLKRDPIAWSRMNWTTYMKIQRWMRDHFVRPPLEVECRLWLGQGDLGGCECG
jgi:hypothetical protein